MKITLHKQVKYFEVDTAFKLKLGALFRLLQEAAIQHSEQVGLGSKTLVDTGSVWILNRMQAQIFRYPEYLENLTVVTWHKGSQGYRAYRDFILYAGQDKVAVASSMWLYFDTQRKRIVRIPDEVSAAYTREPDSAMDSPVDLWKANLDFTTDLDVPISIRTSDFDPLGHVNNAIYFDYIETSIARAMEDPTPIERLQIEFKKEIGRELETVEVGLLRREQGYDFKIFSRSGVSAAGRLQLRT
jgi:acyl-ACP thioesterase